MLNHNAGLLRTQMHNVFRTVVFWAIIWFFTGKSEAQNWLVGFQFGENLSTLTGDVRNDYRLGFMAGLHASHYLTRNVTIRLEMNFERKGTRFDQPPVPWPGNPYFGEDLRFDNLSLPVSLRYTTGGPKERVYAGGGISINYLLRSTAINGNIFIENTESFRRIEPDVLACIGGLVPFHKKWSASLEMRGLWGITKVGKPEGVARQLGRNITWGLMAGLNYHL